jgi:hypothetical protein
MNVGRYLRGEDLHVGTSRITKPKELRMNERIKELKQQAGDYVNETYTGPVRSKTPGKIWEDGHIGWHDQFHTKFAELIVGYCISKINNLHSITADEMISKGYRNRASYSGALNDAASLLRKDFEGEE